MKGSWKRVHESTDMCRPTSKPWFLHFVQQLYGVTTYTTFLFPLGVVKCCAITITADLLILCLKKMFLCIMIAFWRSTFIYIKLYFFPHWSTINTCFQVKSNWRPLFFSISHKETSRQTLRMDAEISHEHKDTSFLTQSGFSSKGKTPFVMHVSLRIT